MPGAPSVHHRLCACRAAPATAPASAWRLPLGEDPAAAIAGAALRAHSLWWSEGAPGIEASLLVCQGMPPPQAFTAMLDGSWAASGWRLPGA